MEHLFLSGQWSCLKSLTCQQSRPSRPTTDSLVLGLNEMPAVPAETVADNTPTSDADRIDRIARLEKLPTVAA